MNTLEKLELAEAKAVDELFGLLEQLQRTGQDNPTLNEAVIKAANEAQSKHRQVEAVGKLVDASQDAEQSYGQRNDSASRSRCCGKG